MRPTGKHGNMALIHFTSCRFQIFTNKVLNSLVDKYQIVTEMF